MFERKILAGILMGAGLCAVHASTSLADEAPGGLDPAKFAEWRLPAAPQSPADNIPTPERIALGKALFFDKHLSRDGSTSCATCHDPEHGWTDGLPTAHGFQQKVLGRATPTVVNAAFNTLQMWDGRFRTLEDQVLGPMKSPDEMNSDLPAVMSYLDTRPTYKAAFERAYPGEPIDGTTVSKAVAAFERTVVVNDTRFDRWLAGDRSAMSAAELRGLQLFVAEDKGNCAACHSAPNFTDNGFHNIGLASFAAAKPDMGRFAQKPVPSLKGAFKTPTLRGIAKTAPYFHDGSAATLREVVEHYARGGDVKTNLSPNIKPLNLSETEKDDLVAFMNALSGEAAVGTYSGIDAGGAHPSTAQR